jgi:hypothetical protein
MAKHHPRALKVVVSREKVCESFASVRKEARASEVRSG